MFMDVELLKIFGFCLDNVRSFGKIYLNIDGLEYDEILDLNIDEKDPEDYSKSVIRNLKNYSEFVSSLKAYKEYLEKNRIGLVDFQTNILIQSLKDWIEELEGEKHKEKDVQIAYSKPLLMRTLHSKYFIIFIDARNMLFEIYEKINEKLKNAIELQKLDYPEFEKEINDIYKLYSEILLKLKSDNSKEFLKSAQASFQYGMVQLIQAEFGTLRFIDNSEDMKTQVYSHITSCLFLLIATYDKIIFSIGYNLNINIAEDQTYINEVLIKIQSADKNLHKNLTESDRQDFFKIARKLRNSATHRISNYSPKELNGYIVSVIKEIYRILNIFNAYVK